MRPELFPYQQQGVDWLREHPRSYLADEAGVGKTAQLLTAAGDVETLVIAPGMIRDAKVWEQEAERIGHDPENLTVISYHQIVKTEATRRPFPVVLADEAVRLKDRKVSWNLAMTKLANRADRVHLASGTPVPNVAVELWAPLKILDPERPAYWNWVRQYFDVVHGQWTAYEVAGLKGCNPIVCGPINLESSCEHWKAFADAELSDWMLRRLRADVQPDLPPLLGVDEPLYTPMTLTQRQAYKQMEKTFLAELPAEGVSIEALTSSSKFIKLCMMSTGLCVADPDADDRHSGKLAAVAELLSDRDRPTLVACYFKDTAAALVRVAERMGLRYVAVGQSTSPKARGEAIAAFQRSELDVLIGSALVIGEGLTLTASDELILVERPWRPDQVEQVVRRLHRIGQLRPVTVRQLVTPKTVDRNQWDILFAKAAHIRAVLTPAEIRSAA
jgi:SNF2 family DNA or RNA helicase